MTAAYIGCTVIAAGSMIVLIEPFTSFRKLPDVHQDIAKAIGVGLIGLGTILSFWPVIEGFTGKHPTLAVLGLCFLGVVAAIVILLPRFLASSLDEAQRKRRDEQAQGDDEIRSEGDGPGTKRDDKHQDKSRVDDGRH